METIVVAIVITVLLYFYMSLKPGKMPFWRVARKHPDAAYDFLSNSESFTVFENCLTENYKDLLSSKNWVGPFRLYVPKIGNKIIYVFGKVGEYERAQDDFLQKFQNRK